MLQFDIPAIFDVLGGTNGVVACCARLCPDTIPPTPGAAAVWKHRRRVSAEWLPVVVFAALAKSRPRRHHVLFTTAADAAAAAAADALRDLGL